VPEKWSVLTAEKHALFREGLRAMLAGRPDFEIVGEAKDGLELVQMANRIKPHLVILNLDLPIMSGASAIRRIKEQTPASKILALAARNEDKRVLEALHLGAAGYCSQDSSLEEFLLAIRTIMSGKPYLTPAIVEGILRRCLMCMSSQGTIDLDALSIREHEVLKLIGEGFTAKEISHYLNISARTVEKHRSNMMKKLKVHTTPALVATAFQNGLMDKA